MCFGILESEADISSAAVRLDSCNKLNFYYRGFSCHWTFKMIRHAEICAGKISSNFPDYVASSIFRRCFRYLRAQLEWEEVKKKKQKQKTKMESYTSHHFLIFVRDIYRPTSLTVSSVCTSLWLNIARYLRDANPLSFPRTTNNISHFPQRTFPRKLIKYIVSEKVNYCPAMRIHFIPLKYAVRWKMLSWIIAGTKFYRICFLLPWRI